MTPVWMTLCARADSPATPLQRPVRAARMLEGRRDTLLASYAQQNLSAIKGPRLSAQHHPVPNVTITEGYTCQLSAGPEAEHLAPVVPGLLHEQKDRFQPTAGARGCAPSADRRQRLAGERARQLAGCGPGVRLHRCRGWPCACGASGQGATAGCQGIVVLAHVFRAAGSEYMPKVASAGLNSPAVSPVCLHLLRLWVLGSTLRDMSPGSMQLYVLCTCSASAA